MGAVYRAWDERLERRVAIKLIRRESLDSAEAHQRFRREARAAAGLNHPAIVGIHDILEGEEGDSIVMELVEGGMLSQELQRGPLTLARALQLGREIAEGLAAAHAKGILHRDLKTDNVMITRQGHAKILDFGLAKRIGPDFPETSLETGDRILGTCHAMSPEQAQGFAVDHRSDLFSLGSLLYETTTGRSPFRGASAVETLSRVLSYRPPSAHEVDPRIPEEVSRLIDALLEKDAEHRPGSAAEIAATLTRIAAAHTDGAASAIRPQPSADATEAAILQRTLTLPQLTPRSSAPPPPVAARGRRPAALAGGALLLVAAVLGVVLAMARYAARDGESLHVAILQPVNGSGAEKPIPELVASSVRLGVIHGLTRLRSIAVIAPDKVDTAAGTSQGVGRALAADEVITSTLDCAATECRVVLQRVRVDDATVVWLRSLDVPTDDLVLATSSVAATLRDGYAAYRPRKGAPSLDVATGDYADFLRLRKSFLERTAGTSLVELLDRVGEIVRSSPRFVESHLLEARITQHRYFQSGQLADLERALAATERARALAPDDPRPLATRFDVALDGGRLLEAEATLDALIRLAPGDNRVSAQRALLLERQGHADEALDLMRHAALRRPSQGNLTDLAQMERRLGEIAAAGTHLEELVERFPDSFQGLYLLAHHELFFGRPERAVELCRELVQRSPSSLEAIGLLGSAHFALGSYREAAESFRRVLEIEPGQPQATLNLAYNLLFLGDDAATALFRQLVDRIGDDASTAHWSVLMRQAMALAPLGEETRAMSAVAKALQIAPESPLVAYQAALVYAVLGNAGSARFEAGRALELGLAPRWLAAPCFDLLRSDPADPSRLEDGPS